MTAAEKAIKKLRLAGVPVNSTYYGFSLRHVEVGLGNFAECGMDNDSSISLSVNVNEEPTVIWFFRMNFAEMADLIREAYAKAGDSNPSRAAIAMSMKTIDEIYDSGPLETMTQKFLAEFE
jgi:hypothetical protein